MTRRPLHIIAAKTPSGMTSQPHDDDRSGSPRAGTNSAAGCGGEKTRHPSNVELEHLRKIADAARVFLRHGSRITQIDGRFVHQIVERDDKSDPHYALCQAVVEYDEQVPEAANG